MPVLRLATPSDAEGILNIYAPYIESTSFTFETETPTVEEFAERISTYLLNWPWLVCEIDGIIAGYAYATRHRERTAYQWCTESSVYIHKDYQRAGIAKASRLRRRLRDVRAHGHHFLQPAAGRRSARNIGPTCLKSRSRSRQTLGDAPANT